MPPPTASLSACLGLLVAALAWAVAAAHADHLSHARRAAAAAWLAAGALSLGTGAWSARIIHLQALQPTLMLDGVRVVGAWAGAFLAGGLALAISSGRRASIRRVLGASICLAAALLATPGPLAMSAITAAAALAGSMLTLLARVRTGAAWKAASATIFGITAMALRFGPTTELADSGQVGIASLDLLATVGAFALLLVMGAWVTIEARMNASLRRSEAERLEQSRVDPLTGLPTRAELESALERAARQVDANDGTLALLVIDLDGFKPINEAFGHRHGDQVLQEMANRLRARVKPGDTLARMGSDVFLLLLGRNPRQDDARRAASELIADLGRPCRLDGRESSLSCSIGIAIYPAHGGVGTLITHADLAMRAAKASGGATHAMFETRMVDGPREQADLLRDLREALGRGQLELFYQPKIHGPSGQITGVEGLMRWHHPKRGMISPVVFIPLAERFGLIDTLGAWVIDEACRQAAEWRDQGLRMRIAINLSARQLSNPQLADQITRALKRHKVNPILLTCEITESVAMEEGEATMKVFERLAATGVHIAIDDFGTGYSSLAYLRKLPARELKIDRSFVLDLESSADARAVVDAVIKLAQALGLKVVAEGVENEQQSRILSELGCDELQGFLFARPMSAKALALWAIGESEAPHPLAFRPSLFHETQT